MSKKYKKKSIPGTLRAQVWRKYNGNKLDGECFCCKTNLSFDSSNYHCGHVIPEAKGGPTTLENLRPVCARCNTTMRTQNLNDFMYHFERLSVSETKVINICSDIKCDENIGSNIESQNHVNTQSDISLNHSQTNTQNHSTFIDSAFSWIKDFIK